MSSISLSSVSRSVSDSASSSRSRSLPVRLRRLAIKGLSASSALESSLTIRISGLSIALPRSTMILASLPMPSFCSLMSALAAGSMSFLIRSLILVLVSSLILCLSETWADFTPEKHEWGEENLRKRRSERGRATGLLWLRGAALFSGQKVHANERVGWLGRCAFPSQKTSGLRQSQPDFCVVHFDKG